MPFQHRAPAVWVACQVKDIAMPPDPRTCADVFEKMRHFERLARMLEMPLSERRAILNLSTAAYDVLRMGQLAGADHVCPELERRLGYALPLMRRLASNATVLRLPIGGQAAA
jgi:hypothetical protein